MAGQIGHKHFLTTLEIEGLKAREQWDRWCESAWYVETRGYTHKVPFEVHEVKDGGGYHNITSEVVGIVARMQRDGQ